MNYRFLFLVLIFSNTINPQTGCLSKTKQLREQFDHKEYAPVACMCPCDHYQARGLHSPDRDQCLQCLHYHDSKALLSLAQKAPMSSKNILFAHPLTILRAFVARHVHKIQ